MDTGMWLIASIILGLIESGLSSPSTNKLYPTVATLKSNKSNLPVVYTAETARQSQTVTPSPSTQRKANLGFVDPIDFSSLVDFPGHGKAKSSYPKETKPTTDFFSDVFNSAPSSGESPYAHLTGDPFKSLTPSASNQNSRTVEGDLGNDGFVNSNVEFRSLFDTAETDGGFSASDFLKSNSENSKPENSKGSQTQAFPSFTYSGRQGEDDYNNESPDYSSQPPRYRATIRETNARDHDDDREETNPSDGNYNGGHRHESPRRTPHSRYQNENNDNDENNRKNRNNGNSEQYGSSSQDPSHSPAESPSSKGDSSGGGKSKCKKVEKVVDSEEAYNDFDKNYDPSNYQSRYKRAAGGRIKRDKRPMTCFVCEDESGRYAERCSYDSSSDPKKGTFFHSTSSSFTDNGKPRSGGNVRHRRNPQTDFNLNPSETEPLSKRIQKRQSQGNRYASDFQGDKTKSSEQDYQSNDKDFDLDHTPRGPPSYFPSTNLDVGRYGRPVDDTPSRIPYRARENEDFGSPLDYGKDETASSPGFQFDFSIPKEFQQDINQSGTSNTNHHRPIYSDTNGFGNDFNSGYDDYVKQHFPEAFNSIRPSSLGTGQGQSTRSSSQSRPSYPPRSLPEPQRQSFKHGPSYSSNRGPPTYSAPQTEHTHPVNNFSPPYSYGQEEVGPEHLQKAISQFNDKDRKDCEKIEKDGMTCYVCRDVRGMNKEECMYASNSNDPRNSQMAYHEVTEYSSPQPSRNVLPRPNFNYHEEESKKVEIKVDKRSLDYDFDY